MRSYFSALGLVGAALTVGTASASFAGTDPTLPGADTVGVSYNLLTGEDMGRPLSFTYSANNTEDVEGVTYRIPDGSMSVVQWDCSETSTAYMATSYSEYSTSVSKGISVGVDYKQFHLSLGKSTSQAHSDISSYNKAVTFSEMTCISYSLHVTEGTLSKTFEADVAKLPETFDDDSSDAYMAFLSMWGTHVKTQCGIGGRATQQSSTENSYWAHTDETTVTKQAGLSLIVSVDASSSVASEISKNFTEASSFSTVDVRGGQWPEEGGGTWGDWKSSIQDLQYVVCATADLTPVDQLLTAVWTDDQDVMDRAASMKSAVFAFLTRPGCINPLASNYDDGATVDDGSCLDLTPDCGWPQMYHDSCPDNATEVGPWMSGSGENVLCWMPGPNAANDCWLSFAYVQNSVGSVGLESTDHTASGAPITTRLLEMKSKTMVSRDFCNSHNSWHQTYGSVRQTDSGYEFPDSKCEANHDDGFKCSTQFAVPMQTTVNSYMLEQRGSSWTEKACDIASFTGIKQPYNLAYLYGLSETN